MVKAEDGAINAKILQPTGPLFIFLAILLAQIVKTILRIKLSTNIKTTTLKYFAKNVVFSERWKKNQVQRPTTIPVYVASISR